MKSAQLVLVLLLAVSLVECRVIYRKYQRTVPPKHKWQKKITEVVEIFETYNRPPPHGSSEECVNRFLSTDGPKYVPAEPSANPLSTTQRPRTRPTSIYANRPTTIRPNPYENNNGFMNHIPKTSVTTTKYLPVPNITIREPPSTTEEPHIVEEVDFPVEEPHATTEEATEEPTEEPTTEEVTTEEPAATEAESEDPVTETTETEDEESTTEPAEEGEDEDTRGTDNDYNDDYNEDDETEDGDDEDETREPLTESPRAEELVETTTKNWWFG